jgi:hypothetical protein
MRIIKSEWHQVEKRYALELSVDDVAEVYPDNSDEENQAVYDAIKSGEISFDDFESAAMDVNVYFDFEWLDEDDWWTDRKGGYEVTYDVEDTE